MKMLSGAIVVVAGAIVFSTGMALGGGIGNRGLEPTAFAASLVGAAVGIYGLAVLNDGLKEHSKDRRNERQDQTK